MKECLTTHVPTLQNLTDILIKVLYGKKRRNIIKNILFDIYDYDGLAETE